MDITSWSPVFWLQNESDCLEVLQKQWEDIPLVNANEIQYLTNQKLVRFRGMVQDMYDPEYYFEKYEVINEVTKDTRLKLGKFMDIADCKDNEIINFDSENNVTGDRQTLVVISVPALNQWVEQIETEKYQLQHLKPSGSNTATNCKRKLENNVDENMEIDKKEVETETNTTSTKKQCTLSNSETSSATSSNKPQVSQEYLLNFPIEGRSGKACHMKVYDNFGKLKINDVCEFVGFLSVDPALAISSFHEDENDRGLINEMELQTHNPSPSLIPRIHCVTWKNLKHNNPLYKEGESEMSIEKISDIRKELMIVLTQILLGDEVAAEYLMYHLISGVYLRQELMALGKFTLNITKLPTDRLENYTETLYELIEMLTPKSHYFPMSLSNMNNVTFTPKKDYDCNRLTSGLLQLSKNTHLILDETKLTPGKLNEAGVKAISSLSYIIKHQKSNYDFNYYQIDYECDIPILILSEGKSLLPMDCNIPLKPAEICMSSFDDLKISLKAYLIPERLNDIRKYLTQARLSKYEISENVQELVEKEFVEMRQKSNLVTADDLHQLLVLARLVCLSEGKEKLDENCWRKACDLELERKARINNK